MSTKHTQTFKNFQTKYDLSYSNFFKHMTKEFNQNGYILGEFNSPIDGKPCVAIATGFKSKSQNAKTGGDMIQTFFIRADVEPHTAFKNGEGYSCCGDCPHAVPMQNIMIQNQMVLILAMYLLVALFYQFIEHIKKGDTNI